MECPRCKSYQVLCKDVRTAATAVYRRRACSDCGYKFTTFELTREALVKALGGLVYLKELIEEPET